MNATSLYVSTCRLVLQVDSEDPGCCSDLYRLIPYLRQSLSCTVCGNLLIEPFTPTETNCQHHVCRTCIGGKKKLKPSCSWCKDYDKYVQNIQLRILLQCYKKLCEYIINSSTYKLICKSNTSLSIGDSSVANIIELIQEGAGFEDEYKSNTGLSKSAYSILPCIYASASTQTVIQSNGSNNDTETVIEDDIPMSNGSSIYSVSYAGNGNKMVIKRKAMVHKNEMENCENLRLLKGTSYKKTVHRKGYKGRGRSFRYDIKSSNNNNCNNNNCSVAGNINSGKVNSKKKKLGCRCGNATASPGKLTCCGQRCPCYVDSKACLDCKCRGCRNPHTKEGQKIIREPLDSQNSKIQSPTHLQTDDSIPAEAVSELTNDSNSINEIKKICSEYRKFEENTSPPPNNINITLRIESLENVDMCKVRELMVKMEYKGEVIVQTDKLKVESSTVEINLVGNISSENADNKFINDIMCNPILFTVIDYTPYTLSVPPTTPKTDKDEKKKASKATVSRASLSVNSFQNILGVCNLDLINLLLGQKSIRENLVVEKVKNMSSKESVSWNKLPQLNIIASIEDNQSVFNNLNDGYNILGITVESVYNVPDYLNEGTTADAVIIVPDFGDKKNITFSNGIVTSRSDLDSRKKWFSLLNAPGLGGRSKFQINNSGSDVISSLPPSVNIAKEIKKKHSQIEWNTFTRCLISKSDNNLFYSKLIKHHVWPIEILISNKTNPQKSAKSEKKSKPVATSGTSVGFEHFIGFLNFSALLYPGVSKVRAACQLFSYTQSELIEKFGSDFISINLQTPTANASKSKDVSQRLPAEPENKKEKFAQPIFAKNKAPTFIIVEIEFWKSFIRRKNEEQLLKDLNSYLSLKGNIPKKILNLEVAQKNFEHVLQNIICLMVQEYTSFMQVKKNYPNDTQKSKFNFYDFLRNRESFDRLIACLESKVMSYIYEKYGELHKYKEILPEIYTGLIHELHRVTNKIVFGANNNLHFNCNAIDLQMFAEEAMAEDDFPLAKQYILLNISKNKNEPDLWLDFAVYCIKLNDFDTALEAVRETLTLDIHHQIGLLLYGLMMGKLGKISVAEITFQYLLTRYPNYAEGWKAFHFFYATIKNFEGLDFTFLMSNKLEYEKTKKYKNNSIENLETNQDQFHCKHYPSPDDYIPLGCNNCGIKTFINGISWTEPLCWSTTFCPLNNINIRAAIVLFKLGLIEFASMALADDLLKKDGILCSYYQYYLAVAHYCQGLYNEAIYHLETVVKEHGKDVYLWSLMGHCYYKLEDHINAMACYEYVLESYNQPKNVHLIQLRMGNYYLLTKKFSCAKKTFIDGCKRLPTPRMWKGTGIACLRLGEYDNAESAFSEANYLDNADAETWGYLALVNGLLKRFDMLKNCFLEAKKRNLDNKELLNEIELCITSNNINYDEYL